MNKENKLVWEILTEDEKSSLLLSISYGKSTWQAGEIMNKAHYKYLEIQARANKFFKMFSEYFKETKNLKIPKECNINPYFRDYIIATVFERKTKKQAVDELDAKNPFSINSARDRIIKESMELLENHEDPSYQLLCDLILEFDRWNNSRILPTSLQEPSAFKRRNKTRLIKHLKNLSNLDEFHVSRFIDKFKARKDKKALHIALLSARFDEGYEVVKINHSKDAISYISKNLRLYIFKDFVDADRFGFLVNRYLNNSKRDCKTGQKFWADYRQNIENAYNYLDVNNIIPRRKNLEKAFRDMDEILLRKESKKVVKIGDPQKRVRKENFWSI